MVDAFPVSREALGLLIDSQPDLTLTAAVESCREAVPVLSQTSPHSIALVDLGSDLHSGLVAIKCLRDDFPELPILSIGLDAVVSVAFAAMDNGASGFVHKRSDPAAFLDAIRRTARGESVVLVRGGWLALHQNRLQPQMLSPREITVLQHVAEGLTARQVGNRLGIEERTVTTHLSRIYKKLDAAGRIDALRRAAAAGLLEQPPRAHSLAPSHGEHHLKRPG